MNALPHIEDKKDPKDDRSAQEDARRAVQEPAGRQPEGVQPSNEGSLTGLARGHGQRGQGRSLHPCARSIRSARRGRCRRRIKDAQLAKLTAVACLTIVGVGDADQLQVHRNERQLAVRQLARRDAVDDQEAASAARSRSHRPTEEHQIPGDARQAVRGAEPSCKMMTTDAKKRIVLVGGSALRDADRARGGAAPDARAVGGRRGALQDHLLADAICTRWPCRCRSATSATATTAQTVLSNDLALSRLLQGARSGVVPGQPARPSSSPSTRPTGATSAPKASSRRARRPTAAT